MASILVAMVVLRYRQFRPDMDHTFTCFACNSDVPLAIAVPHIPKCYRDWSLAHGLRPYCTCDGCGGVRTHRGATGVCRARTTKRSLPPTSDQEQDITDLSDLALLQYCGQVPMLALVLALMLALALVPAMVAS